jgi:predicted nucleotidyltransferase
MVAPNIERIIRACAEDFGVDSVWLFGSALKDYRRATDIDLAVEGLVPERFFDFYGRLYFELPKPVDLVDLSQNPPIAGFIREKGVRIYERRR